MSLAVQVYNPYVDGMTLTGAILQSEFATLIAKVNNLDNDNINATAGIAVSKTEFATGATTAPAIGNNVALTFNSNAGTASTILQTTTNNLQVKIGTATKSLSVTNSAGTGVFQVDTNATYAGTKAGYYLRAWDSTNTGYGFLGATSANTEVGHITGNVHVYEGSHAVHLRVYDPASASDYNDIYQSGTESIIRANAGVLTLGASGDIHLEADGGDVTCASQFEPSVSGTHDLGSSSLKWQDVWATNGTIQTSDANDKTNVLDSDLGLEFIKGLRPVSYKWKDFDYTTRKRIVEDVEEDVVDAEGLVVKDANGNALKRTVTKERFEEEEHTMTHARPHYGLIAQEVETLLAGKDFAGLIKDAETGKYALRYPEFIAIIIQAIKEMDQRVTALE